METLLKVIVLAWHFAGQQVPTKTEFPLSSPMTMEGCNVFKKKLLVDLKEDSPGSHFEAKCVLQTDGTI